MARRLGPVVCATFVSLVLATGASAFDTGPHADMTRDALAAEGFGNTAIQIAQVNNWFVDLYENAGSTPHSGHGGWFVTLLGGAYGDREHWSTEVIEAADRTHFDNTNRVFSNTAALATEWDRLRRVTHSLLREARDAKNPLAALTVLGITLHQVQDFYTHTNWVEPSGRAGYEGPGWTAKGLGSFPTWFDLPATTVSRERLYAAGSEGIARDHGSWKADRNRDLKTSMNKDWPGRPLYLEAYTSAYFATRQWVAAARSWVGDEAFWRRVLAYADRGGSALDHDVAGSFGMSVYSGHWQGQGEPCRPSFSVQFCGARNGPGGSLEDLRQATNRYFEGRSKTVFRRNFELLVPRVAGPAPAGSQLGPVPSSRAAQEKTQIVRLRVLEIHEIDDRDVGALDEAEFYVRAGIAGQEFRSGTMFGQDHVRFPEPNHPFTFLKAVPRTANVGEPLTSLLIEVRTSDTRFAGTDDDVFLRINDAFRFPLDKPLYNDFERGDRDMYSVPIDAAVRSGLTVGDIRTVQIEKSRDGVAGGWKLGGVKVYANNRLVYGNDRIEQWLEKSRLAWRAADFRPTSPSGVALPVWISLWDEDGFIYGKDDHADINPLAARKEEAVAYRPGAPLTAYPTGGSQHGGRVGDGDRAKLRYAIDTVVPQAPQALAPRVTPVAPGAGTGDRAGG
jgi:hypothetical protein